MLSIVEFWNAFLLIITSLPKIFTDLIFVFSNAYDFISLTLYPRMLSGIVISKSLQFSEDITTKSSLNS